MKRRASRRLLGLLTRIVNGGRLRRTILGLGKMAVAPEGLFTASDGTRFERLLGHRDLIVPRWPGMLAFDPNATPRAGPGDARVGRLAVGKAARLLDSHRIRLTGADVLEVGCSGGAHAYALAERGSRSVVGIDVSHYGVVQQIRGDLSEEGMSRQATRLDTLRRSMLRVYEEAGGGEGLEGRVSFREQDVADLADREAFDLVVSWETLEHLPDPRQAFARMFQVLRPGGACFHEYNPFFAIDGGHSLCTLDFAFGHALLSTEDFERYVREFRPAEAEAAIRFFTRSLNRMTLAELRDHVERAGFEVLCLLPWTSSLDLERVGPEILTRCRSLYPSVTLTDMITATVWLVLRKPSR